MATEEEFKIRIEGLEDLPIATQKKLWGKLQEHGELILEEAGRIEAELNPGAGAVMITPGMIEDAYTFARRGYIKPKKSKMSKFSVVFTYAMAIIAGFFVNNIDKPFGSIGLVCCVLLGVAAHLKWSD